MTGAHPEGFYVSHSEGLVWGSTAGPLGYLADTPSAWELLRRLAEQRWTDAHVWWLLGIVREQDECDDAGAVRRRDRGLYPGRKGDGR